jgi:wyosine [tRNA(Phe)-imidazoG37] synthetase (radical SAM superfamily)
LNLRVLFTLLPLGQETRIAFGPVPSRRLGQSLGINNVPRKTCPYSCVYCQVGETRGREIAPHPFYTPEEIFHAVESKVAIAQAMSEVIYYLTFVPDGEPTLDQNLSQSINRLRPLGLPVAVISNASLIQRAETRKALGQADWVSLKIDTVNEKVWRQIKQPHRIKNHRQAVFSEEEPEGPLILFPPSMLC